MKLAANRAGLAPGPISDTTLKPVLFGDLTSAAILDEILGEGTYATAGIGELSSVVEQISVDHSFHPYALVIVDDYLPGAKDICKALKHAATEDRIPVVALCRKERGSSDVETWAIAGADEVVEWPGSAELARKRILTQLDLADSRRSLDRSVRKLAQYQAEQVEFLDNSSDVIYQMDLSGNFVAINKAVERLTGYSREELLDNSIQRLIVPEYIETMEKMLESKLAGAEMSAYEIEVIAKDGSRRTLEVNSRLVRRDGEPVGIQGIARDITERRHTEAALQRSERSYRDLVDNTKDWICTHDLKGVLLFINKGAADLLGYEPEQLLNTSIKDLIVPEHRHEFESYLQRIKENGNDSGFLTLRTKNGEVRVVAYNNILRTNGFEETVVRGIAHDVTDLIRAERAVRSRERQFRAVFESALDSMLILDDDGNLVQMNPAAAKLLELDPSGLTAEQSNAFLVNSRPPFDSWKSLLDTLGTEGEIELRRRNGSIAIVEYRASPSFLPGRHLAVLRDVTERKQIEREIQESNRFMTNLLDYSPATIYVVDRESRYRMVNRNWERVMGRSREEVIGRRRIDIWPEDVARKRSRDDQTVFRSAAPLTTEEKVETSTGVRFLYTVRFPIADVEGEVGAIGGISIDITDRKEAEQALAESEGRFRRTFEHGAVGLSLTNAEGRFTEVNPAFCKTTGYSEEELLSMPVSSLIHPDNLPSCLEKVEGLLAGKAKAFQVETRYIKKGGDIVWVRNSNSLISDGSGAPATIVTLSQDITEWKQAEVALRDSEKRFQSLAEISPVGIFYADELGRCLYVNERFCEISGALAERVKGNDWTTALQPEDRDQALAEWRRAAEQGTRFERELRFVRPDGTVAWAFAQAVADVDDTGEVVGYIGTITDISERKLGEDALKKSEERFRRLIENSYDIVAVLGKNGLATYLSPSFERILGYSPQEVAGVHPLDLTHPDDCDAVRKRLNEGLTNKQPSTPLEFRLRHKDGSYRFMEVTGTNLLDDPDIAGIVVNARDITERRQVEEMIYRLASIVESSDDGVISATLDGYVTSWNHGAEKVYGYTAEEVVGRHLSMLSPPDQPDEVAQLHDRIARGETIAKYETAGIRKDGSRIIASLTLSPVKDARGRVAAVSGIIRDVTESTRLQDQLRQAQKMEAVGRLAGGVAHDFNNLLTAINGYSDLTLMRLSDNDPLREGILEIRKAGDRAASLTRQLLAFSRKQILQPSIIDLNSVIGEMNKMLRRLIGEDVELVIEPAPQISKIKADRGQIEQIIVKLAVNSRDAMPDGGKLVIGTADVLNETQAGNLPPGDYVELSVTDTGCGMDADTLARIFEPFFTTKGPGKGTGLGLATVYGIVKQSGGYISVDSAPGKGTSFSICLPRVSEDSIAVSMEAAPKPIPRGNETVLLIEDEEMVRKLASQTLRLNGYHVLEARHGGEALLLCEQHKGNIQLMLTDVVMPHMSGRQLADRLRPLHPEMKVIYMSGYTDDVVLQAGLGVNFAFIQKPFLPDILARRVREVLDSPQPSIAPPSLP